MNESRLAASRSPGRWRLTGTFTRSASGGAPRSSSQPRSPPATAASTTSFTVARSGAACPIRLS